MHSVNIYPLELMAGQSMNSENPHAPKQSNETDEINTDQADPFACDKTVRMPRLTPAPKPDDDAVPISEKDGGSNPYDNN